MSVLADNVAWLRKRLGDTQAAFAERLDVAQPYISKWERGMEPSGDSIAAMAALASCSFQEFKTVRLQDSAIADQQPTQSADAGETVGIQKLDLSLSMGPGTVIDDYVEAEVVEFDVALIRSITRATPERLRVVTGHGHSMEPTLQGNDMILIDTTDRQLARQDAIYWIDLFGAAGLKRLRTIAKDRVLIISDNPAVGDQEVSAGDLRIDGRAIWFARGL